MELFKISHLPLVRGTEYIGLLSYNDLRNSGQSGDSLIGSKQSTSAPFVHDQQHIFEVAQVLFDLDLPIIPALNSDNEYLGVIMRSEVSKKIVETVITKEPGAIIVLSMDQIDYSLSQIAQIIESNDAKILSLCTSISAPSNQFIITIKVNVSDTSAIIQTFTRYNYNIKAVYMSNSLLKEMYKKRYEQFLKYISI